MSSARWKILGAFAALYFGWGGSYLAARFSIETIPPLLSCGTGFALAGALLLLGTRREGWPSSKNLIRASGLGLLMIAGGMGGVIWAEQRVASGLAALIVSIEPVWMTLYEWIVERRRPEGGTFLGLALGLIGLAYLCFPDTGELDRLGLAVVLLSGFSWVGGSLWSRHIPTVHEGVQLTALYMLIGGIELTTISVLSGDWTRFHFADVSSRSAWCWSYNTFFSSLIGFTCYLWLLRKSRPSLVSTYAFVNPVIALLLGWALANEKLSWHIGVASLLLIAGVASITLSQYSERNSPT